MRASRGLRPAAVVLTAVTVWACTATRPAPAATAATEARVTCPSAPEDPSLPVYDSTDVHRRAAAGRGVVQMGYPEELRLREVPGRVDARWIVQRDGCVDQASIEILSATDERFVLAVRRFLRDSRFVPALRDSVPVRQRMRIPFTWDIAR